MDYKKDFPFFQYNDIVYLDNGATTLKPHVVIDAICGFYSKICASPHRGVYGNSIQSTKTYEKARVKVKEFMGAAHLEEIVFVKNATEALNLIAYSYGMQFVAEGGEIVISIMEHHSNLVTWQQVAKLKNASLKFLYPDDTGNIPATQYEQKITDKTQIVALTHTSNVTGATVNVADIIRFAKTKNAVTVIDGSQYIPHKPVDVSLMDCDFYIFSGHKIYGPTGVGVLYGKSALLEKMPPFLYGGDMVTYVYEDHADYDCIPYKFEAGTQNVADVAGLYAALCYVENIGYDEIRHIEKSLKEEAISELSCMKGIKLYPQNMYNESPIVSFSLKGAASQDVAKALDERGVAIRAAHHCAQPYVNYLGENGICRASFCFYNDKEDVARFINALSQLRV